MRLAAWGIRIFVLTVAVLAGGVVVSVEAAPKYAAIVVDVLSGQVLYARNADDHRYPASLTKIMTLYMVFDALERKRLKLDDRVEVSARAARQPPTKLGLRAGSEIRLEDAILAMVTRSANDIAVALAEHLGGSERKFARLMTLKAHDLGMTHSEFRNASGLPDSEQHTTARDMSRLALAMLRDFPQYYAYFARESFSFNGRTYENHNNLLKAFPGTDGIKTGYIRASGFNLAASVSRDGRRLVGVVFGGKTASRRDAHMRTILDKSFDRLRKYAALPVAPVPAVKPELVKVVEASPINEWRVQVGAFGSYDAAQALARVAAEEVSGFLKAPGYAVIAVGSEPERLYRAQLTPFDAKRAELACEVLIRRQFACITLPPETALSTTEG